MTLLPSIGEQYAQVAPPISTRQDGELLVIVEPLSNDPNRDLVNRGISQISRKSPPITRQASKVASVAPRQRLGPNNLRGYLADAARLIGLAMVSIEELYGIGQRSAGWEVLDRPSRFVDLRWAQVEGRRTTALLERQHSARFCLVLLSPAKYPASCCRSAG